jgi:hypothetical protein
MKVGDRVELLEDMEELKKGMRGVLVMVDDVHPVTLAEGRIMAVHFETRKFPSVSRKMMVKERMVYVFVKDKCKVI